jgi:hypothetical protein
MESVYLRGKTLGSRALALGGSEHSILFPPAIARVYSLLSGPSERAQPNSQKHMSGCASWALVNRATATLAAVLGHLDLPSALGPQLPARESELAGGGRASI